MSQSCNRHAILANLNRPSDANDSYKVKSMPERKFPQRVVVVFFVFLLCALGTPWAKYSAAFPEKVRQCCNAAVW